MFRFATTSLVLVASAILPCQLYAQSRTVETVAAPGADPRHPTASVTHVDLDAAQDDGEDVAAAIGEVAGVHARRTSYGQTAYATVRGSNSRQVLVEYEGLRLNPPFGPGFDLAGTALGFDSVSVWRGAAATYRGSGAVAGALEFRTRHLRRPGTRFGVRALGGSQSTYSGEADAAVATRAVSTRIGVAARTSDGDFTFTDPQGVRAKRVNNDHQRRGAFGATELRDGKAWFRATVYADDGERGTAGASEFQEQFARARLTDRQTMAIVGVGGRDLARPGRWSLDTSVHGGVQLRGYDYVNPEPFLGGSPIATSTESTTAAVQTDGTAWGPTSVARTAVDLHYDDWRSETTAERTTMGVGASWEQSIGKRWTVVGAVRGELDTDGRVAGLPAIGAQWEPTDGWTVRANAARTFRAPNLDELYLDLESVRGNPALQSEHAWVADLGATWAGELVSATLTAFGRAVGSEILFLPVTAYLVEAQNIPGTWAAGAEAELSIDARPVRARAAYTFTRSRFTETDAPVPLQPEHAADVRAEVQVANWLTPWTGATVRGPIALDSFGNTSDGAHVWWNAGVAFEVRPARLGFLVRNILDDDTAVDAVQQPQPGRTYWTTLSLDWEDSR